MGKVKEEYINNIPVGRSLDEYELCSAEFEWERIGNA